MTDSTAHAKPANTHTPPHLAEPTLTRATPEHHADFYSALSAHFLENEVAGYTALDREIYGTDHKFGFQVDQRWVSTFDSIERQMIVPGGELPVMAITNVTVATAYRRRGLLTKMMTSALREATQPAALLWASEAGIYGRFGFGEATTRTRLVGQTANMAFLPEIDLGQGSVDTLPFDDWLAVVGPVREAIAADRPGWLRRNDDWWRIIAFDPDDWREGALPFRYGVHYGQDGAVDGYTIFRTKEDSGTAGPDGQVQIRELVGANPTAEAALWRYLIDMDLVGNLRYIREESQPAIRAMLANPRAVTGEIADATYLRILDVATTLQARAYAADATVAIGLSDPVIESNNATWRLAISGGQAQVEKFDGEPDLRLGVRELSACYLGGVNLAHLHRAGRVREVTPGAVVGLSAALGWHRVPHCMDDF